MRRPEERGKELLYQTDSEETPHRSETPDQELPSGDSREEYPRRWWFDCDVDAEANPLKREIDAVRHD
jgi:hypothetical protein